MSAERGARGHHRVDLLLVVDAEVDHGGPAALERREDRDVDLGLVLGPEADGAEGLGELHVVGDLGVQVRLREALVVEQLLPLAHHAEPAVVHDGDDDRDVVDDRRRELLQRHLEAAVAVDADDGRLGPAELGAERGREAEAHRAEPARGDEAAAAVDVQPLRGPHLVLADARRPDRVAVGEQVAQPLDHVLGLERAGAAVAVRVLELPLLDLLEPRAVVHDRVGLAQLRDRLRELGQHLAQLAHDRHVGVAVLGDLGRVDVHVDDLRAGRERVELAGHAVVEARADRDQQVGAVQRPVRELGAVHAGHLQRERVRVGERALRQQRRHDRDPASPRRARAARPRRRR